MGSPGLGTDSRAGTGSGERGAATRTRTQRVNRGEARGKMTLVLKEGRPTAVDWRERSQEKESEHQQARVTSTPQGLRPSTLRSQVLGHGGMVLDTVVTSTTTRRSDLRHL